MPRPPRVPIVDLALVRGVPSFTDTLAALVTELTIQGHTFAREAAGTPAEQWITERSAQIGEARTVSHEELKAELAECALFVRTGEATPFANVILTCGVSF